MTAFERWTVWGSSAVTALSGLVYLWMKYLMVPATEFAVVNHPLQPYVLKVHIVTAPLLVFAIGLITSRHIWRHLRQRHGRARRTGLLAALMILPMVFSGYAIQAITGASLLRVMAWLHIVTGGAFALGLLLHQLVVRRLAVRSRAAAAAVPGRGSGGAVTSRPR